MHPACGYSLKKASYVVAILEIASSVVTGTFYGLGLTAVQSSPDDFTIKYLQINFRIPFVNLQQPETKLGDVVDGLTTIFSIGLTTSLLATIFGLLLFVGIRRDAPLKLKMWILYEVAMIGLASLYILLIIFMGYASLMSAFADITSLLVHSYFAWIIFSYRRDILTNQVLDITPKIVQSHGSVAISFPTQNKSSAN